VTSPLNHRVVLVTGGARGIGAHVAHLAAARGARVSLLGLEGGLLRLRAEALGPGHSWHECDVTDQDALERAVAATVSEYGRIDAVVANAGIANYGTVAITPVDALARTIEVNLIGVVRTVSATLPHITATKGYYLLVSSAAAFAGLPGMAAYSASKAGVEQFGNGLRLELAHTGVSVGTAHMSWVDTDLVRNTRTDIPSFNETLASLPGPLGAYLPVEECAEALLRAIERRRRRVYVPGSLAAVAALRTLLTSRPVEHYLSRQAERSVPALEEQVRRLGRSFGEHSAAR
jgi:NAD(P)-dependent dehydrogenase (short-subunit alcohol dehydrogenase family)